MPRSSAPALALLVLAAYAWLFPWIPALRSPNELSRLYQARAIVEDHSLAVNRQIARHGPVGDLSVKDGRSYPNKAPGVSLLGAAVYEAVRAARGGREASEAEDLFWLRLLVCMVPGAIAAEVLRRILRRRFDPELSTAGALVFALGTIFWPYSTLFMSHGPTTAALLACWGAIESASGFPPRPESAGGSAAARSRAGSWALAGWLAGSAVLLEYTSALALPPLFLYALSRARSARGLRGALVAGLSGFVPPILILALYHWAAFGHPLSTGYAHLVNPVFAGWHARGFLGVGAPSLRALAGSFVDPARGLFAWCPFLALGAPGLALLAKRDRALALLCGAELALYALFTASFTFEAWGWVVGPRHITAACAFLVPPALAAAEWLRERGLGFAAAGLALFGVASMALTMAVCPYLPDDLTNPLWQLVVPLARTGLRSPDVVARALHARSGFTLLPWAALVAALATWMVLRLSARPARKPGWKPAWGPPLLAVALAIAVAAFHSRLGGLDRFERTRAFMAARIAERP
jgi:hypothetical protein